MSNVITFDEILDKAKEFGEQAGKGVDVQVKFLLQAIEGSYHQVLALTPNKHGLGVDDAGKLAEIYFKARTGSIVYDAKAGNQQKLASCIRTQIRLGSYTKGGEGEPLSTVYTLMDKRKALRKDPTKAKKIDDAANVLMKFARQQLRMDRMMDDAQLEQLCYKKEADLKTVEDLIEECTKKLDKLIDGSAAGGTAQCKTANIIDARGKLRDELKAIATARGQAQGPNPVIMKLVKQ